MDFGESAGMNKYRLESISVDVMSLLANIDLFIKKQIPHLSGAANIVSDS